MKETLDKHFIGKIFSNASTKINILRLTNSYVMLAILAHQIQRNNSRIDIFIRIFTKSICVSLLVQNYYFKSNDLSSLLYT